MNYLELSSQLEGSLCDSSDLPDDVPSYVIKTLERAVEKGYASGIGRNGTLGWFVTMKHGDTVFLKAAQTPENSPHINNPELFVFPE